MDAPAPSNEDESELTESNTTNFIQENRNYTLRHSLSLTTIIFDIYSLDNQEIYEKQYTFNEIVKMNRYFLICESLKDIYDELSSLIDNKKFSINLLNNEMILKFSLPSQKLKEVDFVLIKKNKLAKEDVTNLNKRIDKQDKVIRNQNIRICSLEFQLNNNIEVVKNLEEKIKKLEGFLYDNININQEISDSKKNMIKINDNQNNIIKVNNNKYKIKKANKEEEDISDDITEKKNNMININVENKNIKNHINVQNNNNIIIKDAKKEKKEKMNNIDIDSNEDDNNYGINEDKDNKSNQGSNNNEDNDEDEESNISMENKINDNINNNFENKVNIEDNRNGEITDGIDYNENNNKNYNNEKNNNNDEKEYDSIEDNSNNEETNFNKEDESYLGEKDNKEYNIEESSYTMDNNNEYDNSGYKRIICKNVHYINIEESSNNTENNIHIMRHEDYKSNSIMKKINKNYNHDEDEDVNINISNLEEDFSVSVSENEENIIINKLKKIIDRNCSLDLVYQMIRDGNRTIDFHKKADIKSPTIVLFKTKDGYNFGGYTSKSFKSSGGWIKDPDSFLFNLNNMNKFKIKNGSENPAIFYGNASKYGPEFYDILINSGEVKYGTIYPSNFLNKVEDLKEGGADFTCNDVLVYRVNFM